MKALLYFLLVSFCAFSQSSGRVLYKIESIDFDNVSKSAEIAEQINQAKRHTFTLEFNSQRSHFYPNNEMNAADDLNAKLAKLVYTTAKEYYYDRKEQILPEQNSDALVQKDFTLPDWVITSESKKIDRYDCYKATYTSTYMGRKNNKVKQVITAWFAPELPFPYGPIGYNGLPGLILELHNGRATTYLADLITLETQELTVDFPKGKTIRKNSTSKN